MTPVIETHGSRLLAALWYPFTPGRRTLLTGVAAASTYCLLILSTFPTYTLQLLGADLGYATDAVLALTLNTYRTTGAVGLALVVGYAVLTGVALTAAVGHVRVVGGTGVRGLSTALPGLLASGCASCGAGVLGLLGLAGALALLPFHGNLLRLGGCLLLLGYLSRIGDPHKCLAPQTVGD